MSKPIDIEGGLFGGVLISIVFFAAFVLTTFCLSIIDRLGSLLSRLL